MLLFVRVAMDVVVVAPAIDVVDDASAYGVGAGTFDGVDVVGVVDVVFAAGVDVVVDPPIVDVAAAFAAHTPAFGVGATVDVDVTSAYIVDI